MNTASLLGACLGVVAVILMLMVNRMSESPRRKKLSWIVFGIMLAAAAMYFIALFS